MTAMAMIRSCRSLGRRSTRYTRPKRSITTAASSPGESFRHEPQHIPVQPQIQPSQKRNSIKEAKPFSEFLTDNFNRQHDYLRISVTERCNLRCLYCMPEEGVPLSPPAHLLTTPEIYYLSSLFVSQGVTKIRLTGGEPTVRSDILPLMQQIGSLKASGLRELALTTNGISLHRKLDKMVEAGLTGVNISLDTLDPFQFQLLTRRKGFDAVMKSINRVLEMNKLGAGVKLKVNCVVMRGINEREIIPFVEMGREKDIEVRFIEYMPFGGNKWSERKMLTYQEMLDMIREKYPGLRKVQGHRNDTSKTFEIPGFVGKMGFITSMTHNFCGTCNRLRITGDGNLKVCLHGNTEVSLRDLIRKDNGGRPIDQEAFEALKELEMNRHQGMLMSDQRPSWSEREQELLNVIGGAVKRKKEKHAGMDELQNMENRPMILIAEGNHRARMSKALRSRNGFGNSRSTIPLHLLPSTISGPIGARMYSTSGEHKDTTGNTGELSVSPQTNPDVAPVPADPTSQSEQPDKDTDSRYSATAESTSQSDSAFGFQSLRSLFGGISNSLSSSSPKTPQVEEDNASQRDDEWHEGSREMDDTPKELPVEERTKETQGARKKRRRLERLRDQANSTPALVTQMENHTAEAEGSLPYTAAEDPEKSLSSVDIDNSPTRYSARYQRSDESEMDIFEEQNNTFYTPFSTQTQPRERKEPVDNRKSDDNTSRGSRSSKTKPQNKGSGEPLIRKYQSDQPSSAVSKKRTEANPPPPWNIAQKPSQPPDPRDPTSTRSKVLDKILQGDMTEPTPKTDSDWLDPQSTAASAPILTHLTSSGEAHMIDVGHKAETDRVAIAFSVVKFSNDESYRLITENSNKKGDVLGVARIAGLMAAKRCSDIIPLCHPIPITKVQVDLELHAPIKKYLARHMRIDNPHGLVTIESRVHCHGKTGVEMEALTAASAAALTIYDMCKAVDRKMSIVSTRLALKSGGKEPFVWSKWQSYKGTQEEEKRKKAANNSKKH